MGTPSFQVGSSLPFQPQLRHHFSWEAPLTPGVVLGSPRGPPSLGLTQSPSHKGHPSCSQACPELLSIRLHKGRASLTQLSGHEPCLENAGKGERGRNRCSNLSLGTLCLPGLSELGPVPLLSSSLLGFLLSKHKPHSESLLVCTALNFTHVSVSYFWDNASKQTPQTQSQRLIRAHVFLACEPAAVSGCMWGQVCILGVLFLVSSWCMVEVR